MTTFVDTNVLLALLNDEETHHAWSVDQLESCKLSGPVLISDIVYCEFSVGMAAKEHVDSAIAQFALERIPTDDAALFRAGKAFLKYKDENKGPKLNVLPDFIIGAIAEVTGVPLLTANPKDFSSYFPDIQLITPL